MVSVLAFVVVLGVLIVVHELGHFVTAKASGIAVPRFSIGLGPRIWGFTIGYTILLLGGGSILARVYSEPAMFVWVGCWIIVLPFLIRFLCPRLMR